MISGWAKKILFCHCEIDVNITQFFQSTCKIWSNVSSVLIKKHQFELIFETFNCSEMLFIYGMLFRNLFLHEDFIKSLINKTGRPLISIVISSPDLSIFLKRFIKDFPVSGCIEISI